ncbi:MAG: hypothetical protein ACKPKO_10025, partial [Candidatus Fonsibacter sp.]
MKFNVNFEYEISQINKQELILIDHSINKSYNVPNHVIMASFIHGYCRTCHSLQGPSSSDKIVVVLIGIYITPPEMDL